MSYEAVPLRLDQHREALGRLWAENMSDPRIAALVPARLRWLYETNPDGPATTWLCLHRESGEVVGCGSYLPRPTWVGGSRRRGAVLCDFAVTRAHRVVGAALTIQRALLQAARDAGVELLYGYPNEKSAALFQRLGYRVVGQASTWVKPLRSAYKLRELLRWKALAPAAAVPVDLGLALLEALRRLRARRAIGGALLAEQDPRTDALWERARDRHDVVGEKSAAYLDWRYRRFVTSAHQLLGVESPGGGLAGYAVFSVENGKGLVRDLFTDREEESDEALLLSLARHLGRQGADSVLLSYVGAPSFGERLRRAGFVRRPGSRPLILHPDGIAEPLRARVLDPARWLMLDGEIDI